MNAQGPTTPSSLSAYFNPPLTANNYFFVTRALSGNVAAALMNFTAPLGLAVQFDPAYPSEFGSLTAQWAAATGTKGFFLARQVMTDIPLEYSVFFKDFVHPDKVGTQVTARLAQEIIVEGLDLVLTTGTGAIAANTPVNTALGLIGGRWYVAQGGDETAGILREQITPNEVSNVVQIRIELPQ